MLRVANHARAVLMISVCVCAWCERWSVEEGNRAVIHGLCCKILMSLKNESALADHTVLVTAS